MKTPHFGRDRTIEFQVAPMIDVVFLLVIFFLVSSHLSQQEPRVAIDLPESESGIERDSPRAATVLIHVLADEQLLWEQEPATREEIASKLKAKTSNEHAPAAANVRIRADRSASYRAVEPLLAACADAGVERVAIAVRDE